MSSHKYFLNTSHILSKYFLILLPNLDSHKYFPYKPINYFGSSHKYYPLYPTYYPTRIFYKNTHHVTTKIEPQNYAILTKNPKLIYLVGQAQKGPTISFTKLVATRKYFTKSQNHFYKAQILIWHYFYKAQILIW